MRKKTYAVISDSLSDGFFFSAWFSYYANQFGAENIFVITYGESDIGFSDLYKGNLIRKKEKYSEVPRHFEWVVGYDEGPVMTVRWG